MKFWVDEDRGLSISWDEFLSSLRQVRKVHRCLRAENPYEMLVELAAGIAGGKEITLLDSDLSEEELQAMGIPPKTLDESSPMEDTDGFASVEAFASAVQRMPWKLWLLTSGTTGLPKKVCHTYKSLGRNIRMGARHSADVWAYAYRMSHMAGIQVLLQALMNGNPLIYVFESAPREAVDAMERHGCTHISATPTFYRNILPYLSGHSLGIRHITLGGECYDGTLCDRLHQIFPDARLHNIYASTEGGSLLNAEGEMFMVPESYRGKIRISLDHELLLHRSLLGDFPMEGEWYNTRDLVEERDGVLRFVSRAGDLVNVGGYKVNLLEVEQVLRQVEGVADCLVKGKKNSVTGNILVAEIESQPGIDTEKLKEKAVSHMKQRLQSFKVPRVLRIVEHVDHTRSGKKKRI